MRGILSVAICLLFLVSAAIAEDAVNSVSPGIGDCTSESSTGVDVCNSPSDNNPNMDVGGLSADNSNDVDIAESSADNNANIEASDLSSGEGADVEICDSLSGSCFLVDNSAEKNNIEANRLAESIMADTQMDLLSEGIDARALQIASRTPDSGMDENSNAVGTVHISWLSKDTTTENLTCVLSIEKFLQIWGNSTSGVASVGQKPSM